MTATTDKPVLTRSTHLWNLNVGPLQAKKFHKALRDFHWRSVSTIERRVGYDQLLTPLMTGTACDGALELLDAVHQKYGGTIDKGNLKQAIADLVQATSELVLPVEDKTDWIKLRESAS